MEEPLRYRQLRNYANRRNIRIRHRRDRFSIAFSPSKGFGDLQHQTRRGLPLTPMQQVLIALWFYATGTFQWVIGDLFGVSAFAACSAIHKDSKAIAKHRAQFLSFPENLADTKRKFYDVAHFPGVIGAIDCTHIRIICPNKENAIAFFLTESSFTPSTSKPFVRAMPLLPTSYLAGLDRPTPHAFLITAISQTN